jgi:hypothetical protein
MNSFIEKAAQQALSEVLGFDEGRAYYLLLTKQENELISEFSYSKKYRLIKSLFEAAVVGKFKPEGQDFFNYIILPPSFLHFKKIDLKIIEFLEKIYLKNYSFILDIKFSQIILKDEKGLIIFLLKHFMKESAKILTNKMELKEILGKKSEKIFEISSNYENREKRMAIIDGKFLLRFVSIPSLKKNEYIGYLLRDIDNRFNKKGGISIEDAC